MAIDGLAKGIFDVNFAIRVHKNSQKLGAKCDCLCLIANIVVNYGSWELVYICACKFNRSYETICMCAH